MYFEDQIHLTVCCDICTSGAGVCNVGNAKGYFSLFYTKQNYSEAAKAV